MYFMWCVDKLVKLLSSRVLPCISELSRARQRFRYQAAKFASAALNKYRCDDQTGLGCLRKIRSII